MTEKQKFKVFQSDPKGKSAIELINEFISSPTVNAISISVDGVFVYLLYEDL